jgi:hypothetical protein
MPATQKGVYPFLLPWERWGTVAGTPPLTRMMSDIYGDIMFAGAALLLLCCIAIIVCCIVRRKRRK